MIPRPPISILFPYTTLFRSVLARCPGADTGLDAGLADPFVQRHLVDAEALRDLRDGDAVLTRTGRTTSSRNSWDRDRKSTRLNSSHVAISYAVFCLKKKKKKKKKCSQKEINNSIEGKQNI